MASYQIPLFTFTLAKSESIGPTALNSLWIRASGSTKVSVGRKLAYGDKERAVYTLYASQHLQDLDGVEKRLRTLLESSHLNATVSSMYR